MTTLSPFLRNAIVADLALGVVAAAAMVGGADLTHSLFGLPSGLLFWSGAALIPFAVALAMILRSNTTAGVPYLIGANFAWVAASLYVAFGPSFAPTLLGQAFVCAQAVAVFVLAELQVIGLRRGRLAA